MAQALSQGGSVRDALENELKAVKMFEAAFAADPRNETARFDAAYALGAASETMAKLGELFEAERRSSAAIRLLEGATPGGAPPLNSVSVQLAVQRSRAGHVSALLANDATVAARARNCERAREHFALSEPVLAAADQDDRWRGHFTARLEAMRKQLASCRAIAASASAES